MRDDSFSEKDPIAQDDAPSSDPAASAVATLRILATTDIHMQLLGFDYVRDCTVGHGGLAGLATLIRRAREDADAQGMLTLLLDNGDLLQGMAIGTHLAQLPVTPDHPVVSCLRYLGYDAFGIGNHDLDHGLTYLVDVARQVPVPFICTNLSFREKTPLLQSALLHRHVTLHPDAPPQPLAIGLLSVLPEQTGQLNRSELSGKAAVLSARDSVVKQARLLRTQGADIVILLAHMGIEGPDPGHSYRDDARMLAAAPGIDAIITGHTHRRLPGTDHAGFADVDERKGILHQRPAVMPGFEASDLAVLELDLALSTDRRWHVSAHRTRLQGNGPDLPPDATITAICAPAHRAVRKSLARACGHSDITIHNYFSLAAPTRTCSLVACAKHHVVLNALAGTADANIPVLATAAAHTAGGQGGPTHFLSIEPGPVLLRHLAGLSPYANTLCGLRITGAKLRAWLENVAGIYSDLSGDTPDQFLIRSDRPTFDFDTIFGLDYAIDPTRPAGQRIVHLRHAGTDVTATQPFILATTTFRAGGGGGGPQFDDSDVIYRSDQGLMEALAGILGRGKFAFPLDAQPWRFATEQTVRATLLTSPHARDHLRDISHLHPVVAGIDNAGFARITLTLEHLHSSARDPI